MDLSSFFVDRAVPVGWNAKPQRTSMRLAVVHGRGRNLPGVDPELAGGGAEGGCFGRGAGTGGRESGYHGGRPRTNRAVRSVGTTKAAAGSSPWVFRRGVEGGVQSLPLHCVRSAVERGVGGRPSGVGAVDRRQRWVFSERGLGIPDHCQVEVLEQTDEVLGIGQTPGAQGKPVVMSGDRGLGPYRQLRWMERGCRTGRGSRVGSWSLPCCRRA